MELNYVQTSLQLKCDPSSTDLDTGGQDVVPLSSYDELFLKGCHRYQTRPTVDQDQRDLEESWPDSERPSDVRYYKINGPKSNCLLNYSFSFIVCSILYC